MFYSRETGEYKVLLDILRENWTPQCEDSAAPDEELLATREALFARLLFELESHGRELLASYHDLQAGKLDRHFRIVKQLDGFERALASLDVYLADDDFAHVFEDYSPSVRVDAKQTLDRLRKASEFYKRRGAPVAIKSRGKRDSNLKRFFRRDFLVAATRVWYQGTGQKPPQSKTQDREASGPHARFILAAIQPLVREGLIEGSWPVLYGQLFRRPLNLHKATLLGGRQRPSIKYRRKKVHR